MTGPAPAPAPAPGFSADRRDTARLAGRITATLLACCVIALIIFVWINRP